MHKQVKGIWKYQDTLPKVPSKFRLTLGEGNTRLIKEDGIYFKCEFENPTGSVKDRGIAYQVSKARELRVKLAVISSSGNAAISAVNYCKLAQIYLHVFISPKINSNKLLSLKKTNCQIHETARPISSAFKFAIENNAYNLRQSINLFGTAGFETIAYEIIEQLPKIDAIFIPLSSGSTLIGVADGFNKKGHMPAIHLVQTEAVNPIASFYDNDFLKKKKSLADAIVAKYTSRENKIQEVVKKTQGWGWIISDREMIFARKWLLLHKLNSSYEGAAALAAYWKAGKKSYKYQNPVCLLTGRYYGK